jgi:hypothetical protein
MIPDARERLEERLRRERRACAHCGYEIANPLTDRCPRCFARVERVETGCGSCTHAGACEFAHAVGAQTH